MFLSDWSLGRPLVARVVKRIAPALLLTGAAIVAGQSARAATIIVDFNFLCDVCTDYSVTAYGSFSYNSSLSGVLDYADLTSFDLNIANSGDTFDLAFVQGDTYPTLDYFAYDTATNEFVPGNVDDDEDLLSAVEVGLSSGYFFTSDGFDDYGQSGGPFTSIELTPYAVPEPASLALFGSALFSLGALRCLKRGAGKTR